MNERGKASRALAHSGVDEGDYIFINPRQIVRVLNANKRFIIICVLAAMGISQLYDFFFNSPTYVSEVRLKIEAKNESIGLTPLLERFQDSDKAFQHTNAIMEETRSMKFLNELLKSYIEKKLPLTPFLPPKRHAVLLRWLYSSLKKERSFERLYKKPQWIELTGYFSSKIDTTANFDANVIILRVKTNNPDASADLANVASTVLVSQNYERLKEKVQQMKDFVSRQTAERKSILEKLEQSRVKLQKQHEAASTQDFKKEMYFRYNENRIKLAQLRRQLKTTEKVIAQTEEEIKKIKENLTNPEFSNSDLYLSQIQHRVELLQYQRALLNEQEGEQYAVQKEDIQKELDELSANYQKLLETRDKLGITFLQPIEYLKSLESSLVKLREDRKRVAMEEDSLSHSLDTEKIEISKLPDILQKFEELQRQISISTDLYLGLQQKLQEVEIMEAGITNDLQIISRAVKNSTPIGLTPRIRFVISAFVGLLFALVTLILKNTFIHTIRNFKELQNEGITVIGEVPIVAGLALPMVSFLGKNLDRVINKNINQFTKRMTRFAPKIFKTVENIAPQMISEHLNKIVPQLGRLQKKLGITHHKKQSEMIVLDKPNSPEADIFRYMRLRLNSFMATNVPEKKQGRIILVTSPTEANGKTFISTNLAASFGKGEIKTLLVDLDLRNSSVNKLLREFKGAPGIDTAVRDKKPFEDYIISVSKYFDVLVSNSGIENPTEVLESQALRNFIEAMKSKYDYIFIDSPPVLATCDPSLIAPLVDVILMVTAYEITFREDLQLSIEGLNAGKKHPIVGVLNLVDSGFNYGYGYGYGYHNKKAS